MNLKQLRMSKKLTQKQLAERLGVKRTTICMWETGNSSPSLEILKKIAQVLNCSIDELVKEET